MKMRRVISLLHRIININDKLGELVMKYSYVLLAGMASILAAPSAFGQTIPASEGLDSAADGAAGLSEIVVTAQRREERLQDIPISVNAATAEQLATRGISQLSPSSFGMISPCLLYTSPSPRD